MNSGYAFCGRLSEKFKKSIYAPVWKNGRMELFGEKGKL
jgi:hypothetical protein